MISAITIGLFFVYIWGLGFSLTFFLKNSENYLERNLMRLGVGLGAFPILGVILNLLRIPLDWKIFLVISLAIPAFFVIKNYRKIRLPKPHLTRFNIMILLVLVLFSFTLAMYTKGAFSYPYLEDDDPWGHAVSTKYVSVEKTAFENKNGRFFQYIDPYPPGYNILFGVLHQTSASLMWTLKFFNALIISLGIVFFYFFAKEFTGNKMKALFSAFVLTMIPSYLSHFIWAHALAVTLFFPAMYCLERIKEDKKWMWPSMMVIAGIFVTQPTQAVKIGLLMAGYFVIKSVLSKKFLVHTFLAMVLGVTASFSWWFNKWQSLIGYHTSSILASDKYSYLGALEPTSLIMKIKTAFPNNSGTATRVYTFADFFVAKAQNMINNPIGVGVVLSLLLLASILFICFKYKSMLKNHYLAITLFWFITTFLLVNSMTFNLPIGLFAFRVWMLMAIPISILVGEIIWVMYKAGRSIEKQIKLKHVLSGLLILLVVLGIWFTSGKQKYAVNTAAWGPGGSWSSMEELQGYVRLFELPANSKVYPLGGDYYSFLYLAGFDKSACLWCDDEVEFGNRNINLSSEQIHSWLKEKDYEYTLIDGKFAIKHGANETNEKINDLLSSNLFQPVQQAQATLLLRVV